MSSYISAKVTFGTDTLYTTASLKSFSPCSCYVVNFTHLSFTCGARESFGGSKTHMKGAKSKGYVRKNETGESEPLFFTAILTPSAAPPKGRGPFDKRAPFLTLDPSHDE